MSNQEIIELEEGYKEINEKGIIPFIEMIEADSKQKSFTAPHYVHIYDIVFKMCIQREPKNFSDHLYKRFCKAITGYCNGIVTKQLVAARSQHDAGFLTEWNTRWKNHKLIVEGISRLFTYLDRFHTQNNDLILPLREKGFEIFYKIVFEKFQNQARNAILNSIELERNEEDVDRALLKGSVDAFVEMGMHYQNSKLTIYKQELESNITAHASTFYKRTSRSWMSQDSAPNYLKKAEKMLAQEKARVEAYLNRHTLEPLLNACYIEILKTHQSDLLEKKTGVRHMLSTNSTDDLARMYRLFKKYPADLTPISARFHDHIKDEGLRIVAEAQQSGNNNDPNSGLVAKLIGLHNQYQVVVTDCFESSTIFKKSLKRAFETFINEDERVSNLLAEYVHEVLRKGSKVNINSVDLEATLTNIAFLYLYIHDKDVFERSYQVFLGQRLLKSECENEHSEKTMIAKLKHGNFQWTNKLEGMFKDVLLSKELLQRYLAAEGATQSADIKLEVNVCTTANWPRPESTTRASWPRELKPICESYNAFYVREHKGHKLEWRFEQGIAEVSVNFRTGCKRTLSCSTYQMMLLLIFNTATVPPYVLTHAAILDAIGLPDQTIGHHLLSMAHPTVGVLAKRPNTPSAAEDHKYRINSGFTSDKKRVNIPTMTPPPVIERRVREEEKARTIIRKNQMDAAIVRIMKARKTMKHNLLVQEVIAQLYTRFQANATAIKKRIEALIEQEYLERDENSRGTYNYLA